ncbi:MAG: thiosulfate oxidation carrier protein SoxY [Hyphomicrobiaceae bacterium]
MTISHGEPTMLAATLSRRGVISGGVAITLVPFASWPGAAQSEAGQLTDAISRATGGRTPLAAGVKLDLPELAENGFSVPLNVTIDSPMTERDHVRFITIVSEKNPAPQIARFTLGPRAGRAAVRTHVRLADTQRIAAVAETSTGRFLIGVADVVVTISACTNGG